MNKKQLIVGWVATAILCTVILFAPQKHIVNFGGRGSLVYDSPQNYGDEPGCSSTIPKIQWDFVLQRSLLVLLVGGLLIFTLRDKKK